MNEAVDTNYTLIGQDVTDLLKDEIKMGDPVVEGWLNEGESLAIVGSPKIGKSFFALQLSVHVALGIPFLGKATKPMTVYYADVEVGKAATRERIVKMCEGLGINVSSLKRKFFVGSFKSQCLSWHRVLTEAKHFGATFVVVDPFYRFQSGDENDPRACTTEIVEMEKFAANGMTLAVVFHAPKGQDGDRRTVDRISGSSVLARFVENIVDLQEHNTVLGAVVIKTVLRNYPSQSETPIRLLNGAFRPDSTLANTAATFRNNPDRATVNHDAEIRQAIATLLNSGRQSRKTSAVELVRTNLANCGIRIGKNSVTAVLDSMISAGEVGESAGKNPIPIWLTPKGKSVYFPEKLS